jgi:hypothetical protein
VKPCRASPAAISGYAGKGGVIQTVFVLSHVLLDVSLFLDLVHETIELIL